MKPMAVAVALGAMGALAPVTIPAAWAQGPDLPASRVVVLSPADLNDYTSAFRAAQAGDLSGTRAALTRVEDDVLVGHALALAYRSRPQGASYAELVAWLHRFRGHAYAEEVRRIALARQPRRAAPPPGLSPLPRRTLPGGTPDAPGSEAPIEAIALRFGAADYAGAEALAQAALNGPRSGQAAWWLGLIAFRNGDYGRAAAFFDLSAGWTYAGPWGRAGSRYWAGRSYLALGRHREALTRWTEAASAPSTFYGQLALAQLGRDSSLNLTMPTLSEGDAVALLTNSDQARRAAALAQLGRIEEAERELVLLHNATPPQQDRRVLAFAEALGLPGAQLRIAEYGGPEVAAGFCPSLPYAPADGWRVDRALIVAIMRQESRFEIDAVSRSNARGLMQLLPSTAEDMNPGHNYRRSPQALHDPDLNMALGQSYVEWLGENFVQDGDLAKLFAAYNGGPGWMSRWLEANPTKVEDPLLLLESFPRQESRNYAERVLGHMALCRGRYDQPQAEINALASGQPARYVALDRRRPSS